ncbi:adenosylcobinamide-phosphate synthase CbiB [Pseudalkalibacillus hwajinpoensis]|uniref:adenosylcobinamide-phosphate synthase CbiB n=1 Tax=Guptibacillus hwajinpoensis TaxID=208199 RepID=UPI001CD5C286|nr:adenosylcobinamide-phosphate synthase CbiB [Pseudalkalibacillus hwajinpoensis]MCA0991317.1 adenosylcobinamide-phosphate synthase CbiB [Pseudalkalibacillus hwajinpoensis]
MILNHLLAITVAFFLDRLIGDPPNWPHPVKGFGKLISFLEKRWNNGQNRKQKGALMILTVIVTVISITGLTVTIAYTLHPLVGIFYEAILIATTIAQKSLRNAALDVYEPLQDGHMTEAREKLSWIVGRDTANLNESEVVRGTVETVAENTSDGITAPLFWALIGGSVGAVVYRAINTCDSMVGYRNDKYGEFGYASAKLDDVVNWIPARLTGICMILVKRPEHSTTSRAWHVLFRDAKQHPSPNSGWGEAATAAILGVQLGGLNTYKGIVSNRARMGDPIMKLSALHIPKAIKIMNRASILFLLILWIGGLLIDATISWR